LARAPALVDLGLVPHLLSDTLITSLFDVAKRHAHRVKPRALGPKVHWRQSTSPARQS
jgi:UDP-sulfoquinovose synthase